MKKPMSKDQVRSEGTNVEDNKDPQEANIIPAKDAGTKESDEWSNLMPCAQKMMKGVSDEARNIVAYTLAKHFRAGNVPQSFTLTTLLSWNKKNSPPLDDTEIDEAVSAAYKGRGGKSYNSRGCANEVIQQFCSDDCPLSPKQAKGDAGKYFQGKSFVPKLLADELVSEYHFVYVGEKLFAYQDGVYSDGEAFAKKKCREKLHYAANISFTTEVITHICDMTHIEPDELNTFKNLINLENGMLDWRSGKLLLHSPHYLSTIRIPVVYDPLAKCSKVDKFLLSTIPLDCINLVEEMLGYILIPECHFQKCLVLTGTGSNGKSTFANLTECLAGSQNISKIPLHEIDGHKFKRSELFGMLGNIFSDIDATDLESSSYFKAIVSGDQIDAERKFKNPFFFRPFARMIYSANSIPRSPDKSFAFYRRLIIVPFPYQFVGTQADKSLIERITRPEELSGLLNRALSGLKRLYANDGFTEGETVKKALAEYQRWNDPIAAFVQDKCELGINNRIERQMLFTSYSKYCLEEGFRTESRNAFYKGVRSFSGVGEVEAHDGNYIFTGLKLKSSIK